jgi:hypothetical protein
VGDEPETGQLVLVEEEVFDLLKVEGCLADRYWIGLGAVTAVTAVTAACTYLETSAAFLDSFEPWF